MRFTVLASLGLLVLSLSGDLMQDDAAAPDSATPVMKAGPHQFIPDTHLGDWNGPNRLWMMDPDEPSRSEGTIMTTGNVVQYTWSYEDKKHEGKIEFAGQPGALRAAWVDTFHAAEGQGLHGFAVDGVMRLFGTYPAGDGVEWGWQIEIDTRDREAFALKMFNVVPTVGPVPAVALLAAR